MKPYRWLFGLSAACLLGVAACTSDSPADPGYYLVHRAAVSAVVTPVAFMTAAGCQSANDNPTVGAIVIGRPASGFDLFRCSNLGRDSVHALSKTYKRLLVAAKLRGPAETEGGGGYWLLIDVNQHCSDQNMNGLIGGAGTAPDGTRILPSLGTNADCWTTYTYGWVPDDGGGGGSGGDPGDGGGGGSGTGFPDNPPPNPLPYPVSVTVIPSNVTMSLGDYSAIGMVSATVTYSDGSTMTAPDAVTWSVTSGSDVLVTDDPGTFHALQAGTATITATVGNVSGSGTVIVTCDPAVLGCKMPLDRAAIRQFTAAITDSLIRQVFPNSAVGDTCRQVMSALKSDWANNQAIFMRGNPAIPDGNAGSHDGLWDGTNIHIDQDVLDDPFKGSPPQLLALLMHEEAHKLGYPTHGGSEPFAGIGYVTSPFSHMVAHLVGDPNSCVPTSQ